MSQRSNMLAMEAQIEAEEELEDAISLMSDDELSVGMQCIHCHTPYTRQLWGKACEKRPEGHQWATNRTQVEIEGLTMRAMYDTLG